MITARKSRLAETMLALVLRRAIRRRFHGIYVNGMTRLLELDTSRPVIVCVNHTNWWDGFVVQLLSQEFKPRVSYLAQEERHLARYRFFRWCGVFGIDLEHSALAGMRYALRLLQDAPTALWFFPQGRIAPPGAPTEIRPGAHFLSMKSGAQLLPVIFRYEWLGESRPSILIFIGSSMPCGASSAQLQSAMQALFDEAGESLDPPRLEKYTPLFPPAMSLNKRWDYLVHRLARRREPFDPVNR